MSDDDRAATENVRRLQESLVKQLPGVDSDEAATEACRDILERLAECPVTLEILSETMVGKAVAQLKSHAALGATAKSLVKKWKAVAKTANNQDNNQDNNQGNSQGNSQDNSRSATTTTTATTAPAPAERRTSTASISSTTSSAKQAKKKAKKKASSSSPATAAPSGALLAAAEAEWSGLPPLRKNICQKMLDLVLQCRQDLIDDGINAEAVDQLLAPRASEIENAVWQQNKDNQAYTAKARSLVFNLKKNKALTQQVVLGQVPAASLVQMSSEQLISAEIKQARAQEAKKLIDSRRLDWDQANEDKINEMCGIKGELLSASLFTCGRCKSTKTTSTQKQTRSADEPMTVFVLCLNCGNRWKC